MTGKVDIPDDVMAELGGLSPSAQEEAVFAYRLHLVAADLASELGLDAGDVYHQLRQLERTPLERLRSGLELGRLRRRSK